MKKKLFYATIIGASVLALAGCGDSESNDSQKAVEQAIDYKDGTYRGIFADGSDIQVSVEFSLADNVVEDVSFRQLYHNDIDYRTEESNELVIGIREQHEELLEHLVGKDIRESIEDLYTPENIIETEIEGVTGATVRSGKVISALRDGLNRGVYKY